MGIANKIKSIFAPVDLNDPEAEKALQDKRRANSQQKLGQGSTTIALLEAHASDAGVVDPETSLLIHHPENHIPLESNPPLQTNDVNPDEAVDPSIPSQRTSEESTDKELVGAGK